MTTLAVQSHPREQSYSAALLDAVVAKAPGARVLRIGQGDLWTTDACLGVTRLVAVYPTWWGSLPAELLAALNGVIGPWVDGGEQRATSPFRAVTSITVVTSHGSPKALNVLQGEPGMQLWKRTVLPLCARRATFSWQSLYEIDQVGDAARADFLASVQL